MKDEITEKLTNHTNKLIDNLEYKFAQMNEKIERKQEEAFGAMLNKLNRTLEENNRQNNLRPEFRDTETNSIQNYRKKKLNLDKQIFNRKELLQYQQKKEKPRLRNNLFHSINK